MCLSTCIWSCLLNSEHAPRLTAIRWWRCIYDPCCCWPACKKWCMLVRWTLTKPHLLTGITTIKNLNLPGKSIKRINVRKMLLPKYKSIIIENCLVLFLTCPIRFNDLPALIGQSFSSKRETFFRKPLARTFTKGENNKHNVPLFSFLAIMTR